MDTIITDVFSWLNAIGVTNYFSVIFYVILGIGIWKMFAGNNGVKQSSFDIDGDDMDYEE